jgi:uncharacterized membrane protein YqjE
MLLTLTILPYLAGILLKVVVFLVTPKAQAAAMTELVEGHKPASGPALSEGQGNVILAVIGYSTASITATSTTIMSLIALLVIAMKHHQCWIWECWGVDLLLSICVCACIYRLKGPHQPILKMSVGTVILLLSAGLDVFALVVTVLSLNAT